MSVDSPFKAIECQNTSYQIWQSQFKGLLLSQSFANQEMSLGEGGGPLQEGFSCLGGEKEGERKEEKPSLKSHFCWPISLLCVWGW